jgi:DNA-directed RNA polymerase subunit M/transcription elongation factor TFIIS
MNLPKIETPKYQLTIPSTKKEVSYRPFLVKEEKILLIAQEAGGEADLLAAMKDVVTSCTFGEVNTSDLASFDLEYIFLKLRAKSVGEEAELGLKCEECGEVNKVTVNLDAIEVTAGTPLPKKIQLTDTIGIVPQYIKVQDLIKISGKKDKGDVLTSSIAASIENIYDETNVYPIAEASESDIKEFIESLNKEQIEKVEKVVTGAPKLQETISFTCAKCKTKNEKILTGIESFFV